MGHWVFAEKQGCTLFFPVEQLEPCMGTQDGQVGQITVNVAFTVFPAFKDLIVFSKTHVYSRH
jgi:hypothetical protein